MINKCLLQLKSLGLNIYRVIVLQKISQYLQTKNQLVCCPKKSVPRRCVDVCVCSSPSCSVYLCLLYLVREIHRSREIETEYPCVSMCVRVYACFRQSVNLVRCQLVFYVDTFRGTFTDMYVVFTEHTLHTYSLVQIQQNQLNEQQLTVRIDNR